MASAVPEQEEISADQPLLGNANSSSKDVVTGTPSAAAHISTSTVTTCSVCGARQPNPIIQEPQDFGSWQAADARISVNLDTPEAPPPVVKVSLGVNVLLLIVKLVIYVLSHSKSILASFADSMVDIGCQAIMHECERRMKRTDPKYPIGKTRLETIGIIACAIIMTWASTLVIQSCVMELYDGFATGDIKLLEFTALEYAVLIGVILIKVGLWLYCRAHRRSSESAAALAVDHFNDVLSNLVALAAAAIAAEGKAKTWWLDASGGLAISVYIIFSWANVAREQVAHLLGLGAPESFLQFIRTLVDDHHAHMAADIVRAYHFGSRYLVEVEVLLPAEMTVAQSHDIALSLQHKIECLDEVERAFVHVDYASRTIPEHKVERNLQRGHPHLFASDLKLPLPCSYEEFLESQERGSPGAENGTAAAANGRSGSQNGAAVQNV